jgi:hypothetical protein
MRGVTDHCQSRRKQLIVGCDANAHHIGLLLGSTSTNLRDLMESLVSSNLNILNSINELTFVVCNRKEVIELTLGTNKIGILVSNWHVYDKPSLSDHRYICFQKGNITNYVTFRNPMRSNWELYKEDLKANLQFSSRRLHSIRAIDWSVHKLQWTIILSCYWNCPGQTIRSPRMAFVAIRSWAGWQPKQESYSMWQVRTPTRDPHPLQ